MKQKQHINTIEQIKFEWELAKACHNIKRCEQILHNYERYTAWRCLQDMIKEYWIQINQLNGAPIIRVVLREMSDDQIKEQLVYVADNIPIWLLISKIIEEMH